MQPPLIPHFAYLFGPLLARIETSVTPIYLPLNDRGCCEISDQTSTQYPDSYIRPSVGVRMLSKLSCNRKEPTGKSDRIFW